MIYYLIKAYLFEIVDVDTLGKKNILDFLIPITKTKIIINGYSTLLCDRKTIKNINKEYQV